MYSHLIILLANALSGFDYPEPSSFSDCDEPAQIIQVRDAATVRRLVIAWETSEWTGDIEYEKCLLDPGFVEILADGKSANFANEIEATRQRADGAAAP